MRFIITARKRNGIGGVNYLSRSGFTTYNAERAAIYSTLERAQDEIEYFRRVYPVYEWTIEQLPLRVPLVKAVLRATPIVENPCNCGSAECAMQPGHCGAYVA